MGRRPKRNEMFLEKEESANLGAAIEEENDVDAFTNNLQRARIKTLLSDMKELEENKLWMNRSRRLALKDAKISNSHMPNPDLPLEIVLVGDRLKEIKEELQTIQESFKKFPSFISQESRTEIDPEDLSNYSAILDVEKFNLKKVLKKRSFITTNDAGQVYCDAIVTKTTLDTVTSTMSTLKKHWSDSNRFSILSEMVEDEEYQPVDENMDYSSMDFSNSYSSPSDVDMDQGSYSQASTTNSSIEDVDAVRNNRYNGLLLDIPQGISLQAWDSIPDHSKANQIAMDARIHKKRTKGRRKKHIIKTGENQHALLGELVLRHDATVSKSCYQVSFVQSTR